jgi:hypothetical protein
VAGSTETLPRVRGLIENSRPEMNAARGVLHLITKMTHYPVQRKLATQSVSAIILVPLRYFDLGSEAYDVAR